MEVWWVMRRGGYANAETGDTEVLMEGKAVGAAAGGQGGKGL